jgi:hypothetical protein
MWPSSPLFLGFAVVSALFRALTHRKALLNHETYMYIAAKELEKAVVSRYLIKRQCLAGFSFNVQRYARATGIIFQIIQV